MPSAEQQDKQARQEKLEGSSFTASTTLHVDTALSLYKLTRSQSFWETKQDTRCLVGWGNNTVVVAFRGTASMKNALADLQVCPLLYFTGFGHHRCRCSQSFVCMQAMQQMQDSATGKAQ